MDAAIAKTTNDELKKLQLKLEILEEQLREAHTRADRAEEKLARLEQKSEQKALAAPPPPPPPPPAPPLPPKSGSVAAGGGSFSDHIAGHNLRKGSGDKIIDNVKHQVQAEAATGMYSIQSGAHEGLEGCMYLSGVQVHDPKTLFDLGQDILHICFS